MHQNLESPERANHEQPLSTSNLAELSQRLRWVRGLRLNDVDRDDVSQNVLLRLLEEARDRGCSFGDLSSDDINRCREAERSARRRGLKLRSREKDCLPEFEPASGSGDQELVENKELVQVVLSRLSLPENERTFLQLYYIEQIQDYSELSKRMDMPESRLYLLKHRLQKRLKSIAPQLRRELKLETDAEHSD